MGCDDYGDTTAGTGSVGYSAALAGNDTGRQIAARIAEMNPGVDQAAVFDRYWGPGLEYGQHSDGRAVLGCDFVEGGRHRPERVDDDDR